MGTSTTGAYIESAAGVQEGGRTGLANVITGCLFLVTLFFSPLAAAVAAPIEVEGRMFRPLHRARFDSGRLSHGSGNGPHPVG